MVGLRSYLRSAAMAAALVVVAAPAFASVVIDQNASTQNTNIAWFFQTDVAQSFQQSTDNIAGAGVYLYDHVYDPNNTTPTRITISLWDELPNVVGATQLATGFVDVAFPGAWADVFWSPVAITAGTTYYLAFDSTNTEYGIAGDANGGYADGQVYANAGYSAFSNFDYTFRTYADVEAPAGGDVPEPATLALFGMGLMGLGMMRRRK